MTYQPNFNRKNTHERCVTALQWVGKYITSKPNWLSKREIDKKLGRSNDDLGKWLRNQLLICTDHHYSMNNGKCKKYIRNEQGFEELKRFLGQKTVQPLITPAEHQQLVTGNFVYDKKANRSMHPLQNMKSSDRRIFFAEYGYIYDYDIRCAAPTLLSQYARKQGMTEPTPCLDLYIADRTSVRMDISKDTGLTTDQVKFVINAILQGAKISHYTDSAIFKELGRSHHFIDKLKQNQFISDLREEIKIMWSYIKQTITPEYITDKNGKMRRKPLSGRDKSEIYRQIEEEVMREVMRYMKKTNCQIRSFSEHDGWRSDKMIDIDELRSYVKSNTGYLIGIDWNKVSV